MEKFPSCRLHLTESNYSEVCFHFFFFFFFFLWGGGVGRSWGIFLLDASQSKSCVAASV